MISRRVKLLTGSLFACLTFSFEPFAYLSSVEAYFLGYGLIKMMNEVSVFLITRREHSLTSGERDFLLPHIPQVKNAFRIDCQLS